MLTDILKEIRKYKKLRNSFSEQQRIEIRKFFRKKAEELENGMEDFLDFLNRN